MSELQTQERIWSSYILAVHSYNIILPPNNDKYHTELVVPTLNSL
mgnify:CR=1 FL=1